MRRSRFVLSCLLLGGCACDIGADADAGRDAWVAWVDARPTYRDTGVYGPRDGGSLGSEPCRGGNRRLRFEDFRFSYRRAAYGDRLAGHEFDVDADSSRFHIFDLVAGSEIAVTDAYPRDTFGDDVVAHAGGFDLVGWDETVVSVVRFDWDGATLDMAQYTRTGEPGYPISNVVRTDAGLMALLNDGETSSIVLEILDSDGSVRNIPLGSSFAEHVLSAEIAATDEWLIGAIAVPLGRDEIRFVRVEVELETAAVRVVEMGSIPRAFIPDPVAAYVDGDVALAAFALTAEIGQPSGLRLVWWSPGGAEVARRDLEGLSLDGIGVAGIVGPMPQQTLVYYTGLASSATGRGYVLAARVRAPDVIEGGEAPLVSRIDVSNAFAWPWIEGGVAIAYRSSGGGLEVLLTCVGAP